MNGLHVCTDVMPLLRPLLLDKVESIQHLAALAIGRLANCSSDLAEAIVGSDILPHVIYSMQRQNVSLALVRCLRYSIPEVVL